ncbi:MAG TPA: ferrous iron transport protein B [Pseudothermotoga sp.]|nr:ferrous iron transport protein B [Pseudothermotoga sp.]HOK84131.1 ferrous iron transport protein B [Pseudothermotoga sp.]HPP69130.1 ferrous iron transport protein B [Pseudothermotoga sp.]
MALRVALCGNPNVGKTSLFNALTGMRQYVANWAGVTVEVKEGIRNWQGVKIDFVDLPGTYSLSSFSMDEKIAREYLLYKTPDILLVIVDALSMRQGLYLFLEAAELDTKTILVVNAVDEARKQGIHIDRQELAKHTGVPVVLTSAVTGEGIDDLLDTILRISSSDKKKLQFIFDEEVEKMIKALESEFISRPSLQSFPARWLAIKYLEGDPQTVALIGQTQVVAGSLREKIAEGRYKHIDLILKEVLKTSGEVMTMSDALDHVLTHKYIGIPIFLTLMYMTFTFAFQTIQPICDGIEALFTFLSDLARRSIANNTISSLIADGIISGVGSILVFVPNIFALFLILGIMEESGYLPRAAFVVDRIMYRLKLSGRSFMSFLLGFGCTVPAIMSTRGISDQRERTITVLSVPFISCSARLPVYLLIASVFFEKEKGMVVFSVYLLSVIVALMSAVLLNKILFKGEPSFLVLELPRYRMPKVKNLLLYVWYRGKHFLMKAGTIIFLASVILWILSYFPASGDPTKSFASEIGRALSVLLKPLGFDWRLSTALIFGTAAKEVIVSTLSMLFGFGKVESLGSTLTSFYDPVTVLSFLVFAMAYIPCFATLGSISSEIGKRYLIISVIYSLAVAYLLALLVRLLGGWLV